MIIDIIKIRVEYLRILINEKRRVWKCIGLKDP